MLAVSAAIGPNKEETRGFARFVLDLPGWVSAGSLLALLAAALLLIVPAFARARRRRKGDDEHEHEYQPPKLTASAALAIIMLFAVLSAVPVGFLLYVSRLPGPLPELGQPPNSPIPLGSLQSAPIPRALDSERTSRPSGAVSAFVSAALLVLGVGALAGVLAIYIRPFGLTPAKPTPRAPQLAEIEQAVSESLADIDREADARGAIIRIYRHFERRLARADVARRPSDTPWELMRVVLSRLQLPAAPVRSLTQLFELARFSDHVVRESEREKARSALIDITTHLELGRARDAR